MGSFRQWLLLGLLMPVPIREGNLVVVHWDSYSPLQCRGKRGVVMLVNKFGSCMVYFSELRESYFFNPGDLTIDKGVQ